MMATMILKRTKIIATVGPATNTYEKVRDLIEAGANGIRLNFSHGTHESHCPVYRLGEGSFKRAP